MKIEEDELPVRKRVAAITFVVLIVLGLVGAAVMSHVSQTPTEYRGILRHRVTYPEAPDADLAKLETPTESHLVDLKPTGLSPFQLNDLFNREVIVRGMPSIRRGSTRRQDIRFVRVVSVDPV